MKKKILYVLGTLMIVGCGTIYYGYIDRARTTISKDGWLVDFTYVRWACRTCFGHVERLEYQGKPVFPPPLQKDGVDSQWLQLATSVGGFRAFANQPGWRLYHDSLGDEASELAITAEELQRGYYEVSFETDKHTSQPDLRRKKGTPPNWCRALSFHYVRWLDPALLGRLQWYPPTGLAGQASSR